MPWTLNATCYYLLHYHERGRKRADASDSLAVSLARKPNREHCSLFAERDSIVTVQSMHEATVNPCTVIFSYSKVNIID